MGALLLDKFLKLAIGSICYPGYAFVLLDKSFEGAITEAVNINEELQKIILVIVIIFAVIQVIWFVIDKLIQIKERFLKMRNNKDKE